jgi:hypothetical protein
MRLAIVCFFFGLAACGAAAEGTSTDGGREACGPAADAFPCGPSPCEQQGGVCQITDQGLRCPSGTVPGLAECYLEAPHTCCLAAQAHDEAGVD